MQQQSSNQNSTAQKAKAKASGMSLREVLRNIIRSNRKKDDGYIRSAFHSQVMKSPDLITEVINDYFDRNYVLMTRQLEVTAQPFQAQAKKEAFQNLVTKEKEKIIGKVETFVRERARIMLSDMLLPNGKQLKDCTGSDCKDLAPVVGSWLKAVAERTGPSAKVGGVLTEAQLQELWKTA